MLLAEGILSPICVKSRFAKQEYYRVAFGLKYKDAFAIVHSPLRMLHPQT